ncbi:MAG: hypothetical protein ACLR8X_00220 [Gallintestinimicrobium sp.]
MTWPFENDTSAITKKLAQRSFKANKLRNIVAVIAIVLTSMLFYFCNDFMCWSDPVYTDNYFAN